MAGSRQGEFFVMLVANFLQTDFCSEKSEKILHQPTLDFILSILLNGSFMRNILTLNLA